MCWDNWGNWNNWNNWGNFANVASTTALDMNAPSVSETEQTAANVGPLLLTYQDGYYSYNSYDYGSSFYYYALSAINNISLTVQNADAYDSLALDPASGYSFSGSQVLYNGTAVASFTATYNSDHMVALTITANSLTDYATYQGIMAAVTYTNLSDAPPASKVIAVTSSEADGSNMNTTVTVNITAVNDAPVASAISGQWLSGQPSVKIKPSYVDPDQTVDAITFDTTGTQGNVTYSNGAFHYVGPSSANTLPAGTSLTDTFTYTVTDSSNVSSTATATVTIMGTLLDYSSSLAKVSVNLVHDMLNGVADASLLYGENVIGSAYNDVILGDSRANVLKGGAGNDKIAGGAGADTIDGGTGADSMTGGAGNDLYYVDNPGDVVVEASGAGTGTDQVDSTISYVLPANVEKLALLAGAGNIDGTGNDLNNKIVGNEGNNVLDGGAGADTMAGGLGNDTYHVDNPGDVVIEGFGGGADTVISSISYTLGPSVENLTLAPGAGDLTGTGNGLANVIVGNEGANTLDGGLKSDTMTGGAGADAFVFSTAPGASNVDTITDYTPGVDGIQLDHTVFTALAAGPLDASAFHLGTTATDANQHILYDSASGKLFYDPDGSGAAAPAPFAHVTPGLTLTEHDFLVI